MALTITRIRQGEPTGGRDEQGNPILGPSVPASIEVLAFAPAVSDETAEAFGTQVIDAGTIYNRADLDLIPGDIVIIRGDEYQVEGNIRDWESPYNPVADGVEILVRRAS